MRFEDMAAEDLRVLCANSGVCHVCFLRKLFSMKVRLEDDKVEWKTTIFGQLSKGGKGLGELWYFRGGRNAQSRVRLRHMDKECILACRTKDGDRSVSCAVEFFS